MRLKPGMADEYRRRHDAIWPELVREHRDCGIHDYSIFFDAATDTLFAFCKLDDDGTFADMPEDDVVKRWWKYNADLIAAVMIQLSGCNRSAVIPQFAAFRAV